MSMEQTGFTVFGLLREILQQIRIGVICASRVKCIISYIARKRLTGLAGKMFDADMEMQEIYQEINGFV